MVACPSPLASYIPECWSFTGASLRCIGGEGLVKSTRMDANCYSLARCLPTILSGRLKGYNKTLAVDPDIQEQS